MVKKLLLKSITFWALILTSVVGWGQCPGGTTAPGPNAAISISQTDGSTNICSDETVSFSGNINTDGGSNNYDLQWQVKLNSGSWTNITNQNSSSLTNYSPAIGNNVIRLQAKFCDGTTKLSSQSSIITVNQRKTGSVTISASKTTICPGENINFTVPSLTDAGSSPGYEWKVNGTTQGTSASFSSSTIPDGASVQLFITSSVPCVEPFSSNVLTITHKPEAPETPVSITGDQQVCANTSGIIYTTASVERATSYQWTLPSGWSGSSTSESITVTSGSVADNQTIKVKAINECGQSQDQTLSVNVGPGKPATPGPISDPGLICPGSSLILNVTNDASVNSYTWEVPTGWNITAGQGSNQITVTAGNYGQNGIVSVYSINDCLNSDKSTKSFSINEPAPATPGTIDGNATVCPNTDITYSIGAVQYADEYIWYFDGAEVSGQTGTSITVNSAAAGIKQIKVIAVNECSPSDHSTLTGSTKSITVDDGTPDATSITLSHSDPNISNGEQYFCPGETDLVFSIPTDAKIDSYSWQIPSDWNITSGAGTNQITVTAGQLGDDGQIIFTGTSNDCGSITATYDVFVKNPAPVITSETISGETEVCHSSTSLTYSIPVIQYATDYDWSVPNNWVITSTQPYTNSITVSAGTDDGTISVTASNDCGPSTEVSLPVVSVDDVPSQPGQITGQFSDGSPIINICPVINGLNFEVATVEGADSYNWHLPDGWTITNGEGTEKITVNVPANSNYPNNVLVQVGAVNKCGESSSLATYYTDVNNTEGINIGNYVEVDAGPDQTVCETTNPVTISGTIDFNGAKQKIVPTIVSGSGSLSNIPSGKVSSFSFTYTPSQNDIDSANDVVIRVSPEATPEGSCSGEFYDEMNIIFRAPPAVTISGDDTICSGNSSVINFNGSPNTQVTYTINSGTDQTITLDAAGEASLDSGSLTATTTYNLVNAIYTDNPTCSASVSGSATITITPIPTAEISYSAGCTSETNLDVTLTGTDNYTGGSYSGPTGLSIDSSTGVINPSLSTPGTYTVTYNIPASGGCNEISVNTDVTISEEIVITQQPAATRICEGGDAHFQVTATGDGLTYQWYKGSATAGNEISGATSATLDLSNISATDAGDYYIIVNGVSPCSPVTSEAATLTVDQNIIVDTQPQQQTICENSSATFSFTATSGGAALTPDFTYQWYKGTPGSGTPVNGAILADLTIDSATPADNGDYYVEISGPSEFQCEPTLSEAAALTVRPTPTVEISGTTSICSGSSADIAFTNGIPNGVVTYTINNDNSNPKTFVLDASGAGILNTGNLSATDSDSDGNLDDTNFNYVIQSVAYSDAPLCSSTVTGSVTITVSPVPTPVMSFSDNQIEFCTADGTTYTPNLTGEGTFGDGTFSANGALNLNSSTGAFVPSSQNAGNYTITYSYPAAGGCGEGTATIDISIYEEVTITSQPYNVGICSTQDAEFSVTATGDDLNYQWYKDGTAISGKTSATLSLPVATSEDEGEYYVIVSGTNACTPTDNSAVESDHAFLTVDEDIVIVEPATDVKVCATGEEDVEYRFVVHANGNPLKFEWINGNGTPVSVDANDPSGRYTTTLTADPAYEDYAFTVYIGTLSIKDVVDADEGSYAVRVDGSENNFNCSDAVSNAFKLEVDPLPDGPTVTDVEYCTNETAVALTAVGENLQWYDAEMNLLNDAPVPPVSDTDTEFTYYVTQTPLYCESEPSEIKVFVYARPAKPVVGQTELNYCLGETALALEATAADMDHTLNWYDSETSTTPLNGAPTPQTSSKGDLFYWVSQTSKNGCEGAREKITVHINDLPNITPPENQTICDGTEITLNALDINDTATTFTWDDGNGNTLTGSTITITPSATVTYTITGTNSNDCTNTEKVTITLDSKPVGGTLEGPSNVCETDPTGTINLTGFSGIIDRWEYKDSSTSDWTTVPNTSGLENYTFTGLTEATSYRAVLTNGVCEEVFSSVLAIGIDPVPVGGELAFDGLGRVIEICSNPGPDYSTSLSLTGQEGDIVRWRYKEGSATEWSTVMDGNEVFTETTISPALIRTLGVNESTIFEVEIGSGACTPNVYSQNATLGIVSSDIAPNPVTVTPGVLCYGELVTLSGSTGYGSGPGFEEGGSFDFSSITNKGWRIKDKNGVESNFDSSADNGVASIWLRTNPLPLTTAHLTSPYSTYTYSNWDSSAGNEGNKGFAVVSGPNPSTMETSVFNLFAVENPVLTFDQAYNLTPGSAIYVDISTDGGATYNPVPLYELIASNATDGTSENYDSFGDDDANAKNKITLDLTEYASLANLRIRFRYVGTRPGDVWAVDAISLPVEPTNVDLTWRDYTDPEKPEIIGTNDSETYTPKLIGWNDFEIRTRLTFDSTGQQCDVVENWETISVFVFDQYTSTATAVAGACGAEKVTINASVLNSAEVDVAGTKTRDGYEGKWEVVTGPSGYTYNSSHFSNDDPALEAVKDPNAIFTPGTSGEFTLRWALSTSAVGADGKLLENQSCPPVHNSVTFTIQDCTALDFDGVDDYVDLGETYTADYSIEAWIRPFPREKADGTFTDASKGTIISGPRFELKMADLPAYVTTNGRWYHIAVSGGKMYVDGIEAKDFSFPTTGPARAFIGAKWNSGKTENHFSGWIEEVRIWNGSISQKNIQFTMNQRLKADGNIGVEVDMDHPDAPDFGNLAGYYQLIADPANILNGGYTEDLSNTSVNGKLRNMTTFQENTAPLPYTTAKDNFLWTDEGEAGPWTHWDVWDIPHANGINGTPITWNIVRTSNYVESGNKDIIVLGLIVKSNELDILNPSGAHDETNTGQRLEVTHYLKIDGVLDLTGESQLLQPIGSIVDANSLGYLERDQQGTESSFNYNYWSSPVSPGANNVPYTVAGVMLDGTNSITPQDIDFGATYAYADVDNYSPGQAKKVSTYWLHKFHGTANDYFTWSWIGSTGSLNVGEGYSMKGTSRTAPWKTSNKFTQNYTFTGLPNNGDINLTIAPGENYLVGNPYPSALNADQFILDNLKAGGNTNNVFNGTVYFWSHFSGATHYLEEYIGGYATYNLSGGVIAYANDDRINATGGSGGDKPQKFIPVGQAFFVNTVLDESLTAGATNISIEGGSVNFNNAQRIYERELDQNRSVFHSQEKKDRKRSTATSTSADARSKIWLKFRSPKGYHRQILVTADENATDGYDLGYDAPLIEDNVEDMYWFFSNYQFVIQGVADFNLERELPLGVKVKEGGNFSISIDELMNVPDDMDIFLYDSLHQVTHDLRNEEYKTQSEAGVFTDRFKLVFKDKTAVEPAPIDEPLEGDIEIIYVNGTREIIVRNPELIEISRVYLNNVLGQQVHVYYNIPTENEIALPVTRFSSGVYFVKLHSEKGIVTKKFIFE